MASKGKQQRESARMKESDRGRIMDDAARTRRLKKQVEALEADNFQDDPHAGMQQFVAKKLPKFLDSDEKQGPKRKRKRGDHFKQRFRKTLQVLLEEEKMNSSETPNYFSAQAPPSKFPARHFCAVCGFNSDYVCVQCGARYCSVKCLETHKETRCMKWIA